MLDYILAGLEMAASWQSILMIALGLLSGIVIGAIPGMTADIGIILCLPLTYAMDPIPAMMLLLGIYCGGTYGGSITAILINTPGTPANAATTLDGYPMTLQGKSLKALQMALYSSFFGGIVSALICLFAAPAIARVAQTFGPPEYFCITFFGLSIIASISGDNIIKGIMGGVIGIFIALIGQDSVSGVIRFAFGNRKLAGGIPLLAVLVGLFALAELLSRSNYDPKNDPARKAKIKISQERVTWKEIKQCFRAWVVSSVIGTVVGATPGTGGGIAAFISYDQAKKMSKHGDNFGKGEIDGSLRGSKQRHYRFYADSFDDPGHPRRRLHGYLDRRLYAAGHDPWPRFVQGSPGYPVRNHAGSVVCQRSYAGVRPGPDAAVLQYLPDSL